MTPDSLNIIVNFATAIMTASTPLLLAGTGELITERSGVLNLGVEGMMLVGAVAAFAVTIISGSFLLGIAASILAGMAMALIFAFLTLTLLANQVATGLALTIFGTGLSALMGSNYVGLALSPLPKLNIAGLSDLPLVGPTLFAQDGLVYLSLLLVIGCSWFLFRSHSGLILRAIGDSHDAAHALGHPVLKIRYRAVLFGGALSGLAGAYMSLSYSPSWSENMVAGRGWIALALVVFAAWRPLYLLLGAYLFGGILYSSFYLQGLGQRLPWNIVLPSQFISALPYLATIIVLVLISMDFSKIRLHKPACLGQPFYRGG